MNSAHRILITLTASLLFSGVSMAAWSQDKVNTSITDNSLSLLFNCVDIGSDTERLACQDREIQKLQLAMDSKKLIVIDEKSATDIRKKSFGFSLPKLGLPDFGNDSEKTEAIQLPIVSVRRAGRKLIIEMENGQIWQSVESYVGYLPKRGKLSAKIKSASFGSFRMTISNEKSKSKGIRVRRLE